MKALVIGYGSIGKRHISNLSKFKNIEISVVTSRNSDNFLLKNKCKLFKTIKDAIKEHYDFCIISNASSLHMQSALMLATHGIHLFIEKPLSNSLSGINSLLKKSQKQKLITQIGCNLRFHPCIKEIKTILSKNKIGKVYSIQIENGSFLPNWHPDEDYRKSYAAQQKMGGGVVLTCIHEIDYLYWFFGKIHEVFSFTKKLSDLKIDCEDISSILMTVGKNITAEIHLDYFQQPPKRSCKIIGSSGTIVWNFESNTVKLYNSKQKKWTDIIKVKKYDYNQMYVDELTHFINCVKNKKTSINPISDGIKTLKIALAIKKSSELKKVIKLE